MSKLSILTVTAALLLVATNSFAGMIKQPGPAPAAASAAAKTETATGKIVSINNSNNEVIIQLASGKQKTFVIDAATLSSLTSGEKVHIRYKAGDNHAQSVKVDEVAKAKNK